MLAKIRSKVKHAQLKAVYENSIFMLSTGERYVVLDVICKSPLSFDDDNYTLFAVESSSLGDITLIPDKEEFLSGKLNDTPLYDEIATKVKSKIVSISLPELNSKLSDSHLLTEFVGRRIKNYFSLRVAGLIFLLNFILGIYLYGFDTVVLQNEFIYKAILVFILTNAVFIMVFIFSSIWKLISVVDKIERSNIKWFPINVKQ